MKADKLRGLDEEEMHRQLREMEEQLFRFHFQKSMGQLEGLKKARAIRKDRARIYTLLRERQLAAKATPEANK
ncbi:MAG: 50S ribosomal protein L29 [Acidobacteriia bacterium]|nr:50S ribosomal protein L29 [Terriglobia bacterium]MBV9746382.1 50S ribosomal protein L29 [Terriglobia bacterium]